MQHTEVDIEMQGGDLGGRVTPVKDRAQDWDAEVTAMKGKWEPGDGPGRAPDQGQRRAPPCSPPGAPDWCVPLTVLRHILPVLV